MSATLKLRDHLVAPQTRLIETRIKPGNIVLDFGCGPGSFSIAAAEIVEKSGIVYALDAHPLAIEQVSRKASQRGLSNIRTILSDGQTGLPDNYVDIVLLYDVFHSLIKPDLVLKELNRVLKKDGILSFTNHSKRDEFVSVIKNSGLFKLQREGRRTISFSKI